MSRRWLVPGVLLAALATASPAPAAPGAAPKRLAATTFHVAPYGSDGNPGTLAAPWRTIQKAADTLEAGDTVLIRAGSYRERVVPRGSGTAGAEVTYAAYPGETPVLDGTGVVITDGLAGLLEISRLSYVRVRGLAVQNVGPGPEHAGILVDRSHHVVLEGNSTYDTSSSGIAVWGSEEVTVDGNEVVLACNGGQRECITIAGTSGFDVKGNVVRDGGSGAIGGGGIGVRDGSHGGRVRGNRVYRLRDRPGIAVDAWDERTYDVELDANLVHDVENADAFALASEMGGLLQNVRVTNNVAYGNGRRGLAVPDQGGTAERPMSELLIANNTFVGNGVGQGGGISIDNAQATGVVVRNNLVSGNLGFQVVVAPTVPFEAVTVDHNLIDGFRGAEGETRGSDFVEADPLFAAPAAHDYRLTALSPAIDRGSATRAPAADFDGVARPQGAGFDIGAFERPGGTSACQASGTALCLNGSRFRVTATFRDYAGNAGAARAVPLTNDTGYFWFFSPQNVEVVVKVLDFCGGNGHWAVYAAGLTDVGVDLAVTDTVGGSTKTYANELGTPFVLVRDAPFACP